MGFCAVLLSTMLYNYLTVNCLLKHIVLHLHIKRVTIESSSDLLVEKLSKGGCKLRGASILAPLAFWTLALDKPWGGGKSRLSCNGLLVANSSKCTWWNLEVLGGGVLYQVYLCDMG